MNKPLILLVGKSGSGKTTVANYLESEYKLKSLESYTTRPKRYDDEKGHIFVTYEDWVNSSNKVAHTYFNGHHYWATKEQCDDADVYVIDPDGVDTLIQNYNSREFYIVYLEVNWFIRLKRMLKRGDGVIAAFERIIYDAKAFRGFKSKSFVHIVKRKPVATIAAYIFYHSRNRRYGGVK